MNRIENCMLGDMNRVCGKDGKTKINCAVCGWNPKINRQRMAMIAAYGERALCNTEVQDNVTGDD